MSPETKYQDSGKKAVSTSASDDVVRLLTTILTQVQDQTGVRPPPLSPEALAAIAAYNEIRNTLDHDQRRPNVG